MTAPAWSVTLGSWVAQPGTNIYIDTPGPTGFGGSASRNSDMPRGMLPGSVSGRDVPDATVGQVPILIDFDNAVDAWNALEVMRGVWTPDRAAEVPVTFGDVRGEDRTYYGRPDGLRSADLTYIDQGLVSALVAFRCLDPYAYGPAVTSSLAGTFTSSGTKTSDRAVMTVTGNGSTPTITNTNTGTVTQFNRSIGSGAVVVLDGRNRTAVDGTGGAVTFPLTVPSGWPAVAAGSNTYTVSGATSVSLVWQPAYS